MLKKDKLDRLEELRTEMCKKEHVLAKLEVLRQRRGELAEEVSRLKDVMQYEKADVERLEKMGAVSFIYSFLGKKQEMLDKEKKEAMEASANYYSAYEELSTAESKILRLEKELKYIDRCEEHYEELWNEIISGDVASEDNDSEKMLEYLSRLTASRARLNEVNEAIVAGKRVIASIETIRNAIDEEYNARRYSTAFDGSERNAHENMKMAENLYVALEGQLLSFKAELADVNVDLTATLKQYKLVTFSNYMMEDLFGVASHEFSAYVELSKLKAEVGKVMNNVYSLREGIERNIDKQKMLITRDSRTNF